MDIRRQPKAASKTTCFTLKLKLKQPKPNQPRNCFACVVSEFQAYQLLASDKPELGQQNYRHRGELVMSATNLVIGWSAKTPSLTACRMHRQALPFSVARLVPQGFSLATPVRCLLLLSVQTMIFLPPPLPLSQLAPQKPPSQACRGELQ